MSMEDNIDYKNEGESCVVCGKSLRPGEILATIHEGESKLPICCPLCLEAYQKDPKPYLDRLARRVLLRELRALENPRSQ